MKKLFVLALVLTLAVAVNLTGSGKAFCAEPDTFKIGNIWPFTGPFGIYGEDGKRSIELAVEHYGGKVLGKPIELLWEDSQSNPKEAIQKTIKVIASGAQFITGDFSSSATLAMMPICAQRKIPHISFLSTHDDITGKAKTRYTFRTSTPQAVENKIISKYLKDSGSKSVYSVGADYGVVRDNVLEIEKDLNAAKIKTDHSFAPMGTNDFSVIIEKIKNSDADTLLLMTLGRDMVALLKQIGQSGLTKRVKLASTLVVSELCAMAYPYAIGLVNSSRWNFDLDNPMNRKYMTATVKKYGPENLMSPDFYDGILWFLSVIDSTKSWDKEKWIDAMEKSRFMSTKGLRVMRASDHQALQDAFIGEYFPGEGKTSPFGLPYPKCGFKVIKTFPAKELY